MIAFFSDSKAVTIHINKFGEQFIDLFALIIIWIISLSGLIILFLLLREEKISKKSLLNFDKRPMIDENQSFFDIGNNISVKIDKREITGVLVEPLKNTDEKIELDD